MLLPDIFSLGTPSPLVAFPWGSMSMSNVLCSATANEADRFTEVVVFPTPPFWFAILITRAIEIVFSPIQFLTLLWKKIQGKNGSSPN
jgi:hypothetical protein